MCVCIGICTCVYILAYVNGLPRGYLCLKAFVNNIYIHTYTHTHIYMQKTLETKAAEGLARENELRRQVLEGNEREKKLLNDLNHEKQKSADTLRALEVNMRVCEFVCVYVCEFVCVYVCEFVCVYVCELVCVYVSLYACMYVS